MQPTGVHANLAVPDLDQARAFYTDYLGLSVEEFSLGWVARFTTPDGRASVQLVTHDATAPHDSVISVHVGDGIDEAYAEARRRGYEIVHPLTTEPWGIRRFLVRAPDGNVVNVNSHEDRRRPTGDRYEVFCGAGTLRSREPSAVTFPHRWTPEGVTVEGSFTGAHLLHLSVAGCVLNDLYREAGPAGVELRGARVVAGGDFDAASWQSLGVTYRVELDSPAPAEQLAALLGRVDEVAEMPQAIRRGASVERTP